jgi:hypothetical protein
VRLGELLGRDPARDPPAIVRGAANDGDGGGHGRQDGEADRGGGSPPRMRAIQRRHHPNCTNGTRVLAAAAWALHRRNLGDYVLALNSDNTECMATQIAYSTRLDRNDGVYVANSTARFRTGFWVIRDIPRYRCGTSFTTDKVRFDLGPDLPFNPGIPTIVNTGWSFVVR